MKIFGKRKSPKPSADSTDKTTTDDDSPTQDVTPTSPVNDNIPSYFSASNDEPKKKKPKKNPTNEINGEEIETLLQMDYEQLNSKQRRLVRRHRERSGQEEEKSNEEKGTDGAAADTNTCDSKVQVNETTSDNPKSHAPVVESNPMNDYEKELLLKLEPLNSKDRRKFLRELRNNNPNNINIEKLEEEAKRIADRNVRQSKEPPKPKEEVKPLIKPKRKSSKKKTKDLSHLPPEEIARREQQRKMQIEAAERRARGEDLNHGHKHPLNSERRRANRRKPARKSQGNGRGGMKGEFNSVGYQMRKNA